jgi:polar amino acid transport system permease protein
LLAQLYFLYFGLPRLGVVLPEMLVGIIALSLNSGATSPRSSIWHPVDFTWAGRAGIASGMTYLQRMRLIILPQVKVTIPPLLGQAIALVKDLHCCP